MIVIKNADVSTGLPEEDFAGRRCMPVTVLVPLADDPDDKTVLKLFTAGQHYHTVNIAIGLANITEDRK